MSQEKKAYQINEDTKIELRDEEITEEELEKLRRNNVVVDYKVNNYELEEMKMNAEMLSRIAFEYDILKSLASSVELEVMRVFRNRNQDRFTTSEISDIIGKSPSSVSRALGRLVDKNQITKVQRGLYEY